MMQVVAGLVTQVLHIVLMSATAPTLVGMQRLMQARLVARVGPPLLQPWQELIRLHAKESVLAEGASTVTSAAPVISVAAIAIATCLVPSFTLGMASGCFADLLVIFGLLALARCAMALAAMDAGTASGGVNASRSALLACIAEPALLLVLFQRGLLAGSLNLDVLVRRQIESDAGWTIDGLIALAAILLVAFVGALRNEALADDYSGSDLALLQVADALRWLLWFNLIGAMFVPFGLAPAGEGPGAWMLGFACWLVRTLVLAATFALLRTLLGRISLARAAQGLGVAVLLGLLAVTFLLAQFGTA